MIAPNELPSQQPNAETFGPIAGGNDGEDRNAEKHGKPFRNPSGASIGSRRGIRSAGFALIETLVAVLLLALSIFLAVYQLKTVSNSNLEARRISSATSLALSRMESLRSESVSASSSAPEALNESGNDTAPAYFSRSWTVTPSAPVAGLSTIQVTVSWPAADGSNRQVVMESVK